MNKQVLKLAADILMNGCYPGCEDYYMTPDGIPVLRFTGYPEKYSTINPPELVEPFCRDKTGFEQACALETWLRVNEQIIWKTAASASGGITIDEEDFHEYRCRIIKICLNKMVADKAYEEESCNELCLKIIDSDDRDKISTCGIKYDPYNDMKQLADVVQYVMCDPDKFDKNYVMYGILQAKAGTSLLESMRDVVKTHSCE